MVIRGEFLLDIRSFKHWKKELRKENKNKRGRPFLYPECFIEWQAIWPRVDYRGLEGIACALKSLRIIPRADDYTTAWQGISKMVPEIKLPSASELEVAADSTELKTGSAGEYMTYRYGKPGKKRKHVVLVITVDIKRRKLLGVDAYVEGRGRSEARTAVKMLANIRKKGKTVKKFYGDAGYDTNPVFSSLKDAESAVKIRENATTDRSRGCRRRRDEIRRYHSLGYKRWKEQTGYGKRWAVEGFFSAMKRKFGEGTTARKVETLTAEAVQRAWASTRWFATRKQGREKQRGKKTHAENAAQDLFNRAGKMASLNRVA
ncbi:transposase [Tardisphaera miroshnichenkoae]